MEALGERLDQIWVGTLAGLIGPWFGFLAFYFITYGHRPLSAFSLMLWRNQETYSAVLAVSLTFNIVFFLIAMRYDWYKAARGVLTAIFIYAPVIVYFRYA